MKLIIMQTINTVNTRVQAKYPYLEFITYLGATRPSSLRDTRCGHIWETRPEYVYSRGIGIICPYCNNTNFKYTDDILKYKLRKYTEIVNITNYKTSKDYATIHYKCGHTASTILGDLINKGTRSICRECTPQKYVSKLHSDFEMEVFNINPDLILLEEYTNDNTYIKVSTSKCNHTWKILPHNFLAKKTLANCPICEPKINISNISKGEQELFEWLSKYTKVSRKSGILNGLDIDIFLDQYNIGIEYNGEYWHGENHRDPKYHINKTNVAKFKDIRLIHIFEHQWNQKQYIVKSRLLSLLKYNLVIGARECKIKQIAFPKDFLNDNHIQGCGSPTKYNFGLYYKDELIAVMTFSKPRFTDSFEYELIRYTSMTNINVIGGASKLFKYFVKNYNPKSVISYSDRCWSVGDLYKTLNFKFLHTSNPSYFYAKHSCILSRYQTQKHKLKELFPSIYKEELSESEIMKLAGYYKVYDCGSDVWGYYGTNV